MCVPIVSTAQGEQFLYDPALLERLDFAKSTATFRPAITAAEPGEPWLLVRPLKESDYDRGFLQLLGQLTAVGAVSRAAFLSAFLRSHISAYVSCIDV